MSHYTRLEVAWDDTEQQKTVDEDALVERARIYFLEQGFSEDGLDDLRVALKGMHNDGLGFNKMYSDLVLEMLEFISCGFPNTRFWARGCGEEHLDLWVREFKNGEAILSYGPWM
jgi:hypothetical protein